MKLQNEYNKILFVIFFVVIVALFKFTGFKIILFCFALSILIYKVMDNWPTLERALFSLVITLGIFPTIVFFIGKYVSLSLSITLTLLILLTTEIILLYAKNCNNDPHI